jgi:hypothetical protein
MARKRCQKQAGAAGATKQSGATHSSQEKQDDGVTQGTSPGEIHEDADGNLDIHADISATTSGDDRPGLHVHEGQTGDQLPEDVDGDKKEGQAGDDQPPEKQENHEGQASDQLPGEDENNGDNNAEDNNNDGDGAVPLAPKITPQFDSKDLYKVLGAPMNATERQIKSAYFNLAKKHHPECQPIHLSKDDANLIFLLSIMPMRYWVTRRKKGFMMHLCALVK